MSNRRYLVTCRNAFVFVELLRSGLLRIWPHPGYCISCVVGVYSSDTIADTMYDSIVSMDSSVEDLDSLVMGRDSLPDHPPIVNPIDKLYSMQNSYFNGQ